VKGLDSLRFLLALWVVFGHFGFVPLERLEEAKSGFPYLLRGIYNNLFCGPAAVIAFFVISGFCIHYQYHDRAIHSLRAFYVRRYLRIGIPMLAGMSLYFVFNVPLRDVNHTMLWSLVCEEIYYFLYPLLLWVRSRVSWTSIIAVSYALSYAVVLTNPRAGDYPSYGVAGNWLLGYPCWLLGCRLAERCRSTSPPAVDSIWVWRIGAWELSWLASAMRFHSPVGYPWTLNLFALFVYIWLEKEVIYRRTVRPALWLERLGMASYSLYLTHPLGKWMLWYIPFSAGAVWMPWLVRLAIILSTAFVFFWLVERPSHQWARRAGRRLSSAELEPLARAHAATVSGTGPVSASEADVRRR
jgi:peptidoglycan/LPS O-acetylase OafA/YrhL